MTERIIGPAPATESVPTVQEKGNSKGDVRRVNQADLDAMALSTELDLDASVDRDRFMELTTASNRWINQLERSTSAFQARCKAEKEAEEEEAVQAAVAAKKAADEAREAKKAANGKATSRTRSMTTKATGPAGVEVHISHK
ncbi:MAG: hypothetical protein Q9179_006038 [Wetmoreana sp. 5 TL-2023]